MKMPKLTVYIGRDPTVLTAHARFHATVGQRSGQRKMGGKRKKDRRSMTSTRPEKKLKSPPEEIGRCREDESPEQQRGQPVEGNAGPGPGNPMLFFFWPEERKKRSEAVEEKLGKFSDRTEEQRAQTELRSRYSRSLPRRTGTSKARRG